MSAYAGQDQRRKALNHFPPHPFLTIRLHTGTLLILPQSHEAFDMRRFQIYREWYLGRGAGAYELESLRKLDWHVAAQIRDFYNSLLGGGANRLTDQQILDWLRSEVQSTALAAFWLQDEWMLGGAVTAPAASRSPPPASLPVAQWTVKHKIEAMFEAIPGHLGPAAREQFNAFLTPQNLAIMVGFLAAGLAIQAIPVADAVADAIIAALAYAMYGWAGLVAGYEFTQAVIQAGRAQSRPDIDHAAQEAADALIALGVTLFLSRLVEKIKVDSGKEQEPPAKTESLKKAAPKPPFSTFVKPNPFLPMKIGMTEPGAVPWTPELQTQMDAANARGAMSAPGYPDLPAHISQTFSDAVPWNGDDPGNGYDIINRVIGDEESANGSYWAEGIDAPNTEAEWRSDFAVKNDWNGDGGYVISSTKGLRGWIGPAAPQMSSDGSSVLLGNGQQIWIPRDSASPSSPIPTPWNDVGN
ncbi:hypothetical protein [Acidocella facilis]|uniref:hypothetical protein n=1 Tax=Acidocella facilis TaxID=525 RepID=UPI000B10B966|nr:hypothetical protein [Acidocella facilis]